MIYDYHLRTEFPGDFNTSVSLQIEKAVGPGMKEICIIDHHDCDFGFCGCDFILNIPAYLTALHMLRVDYRDHIRINIGIELGLQEHLKQYLEHFVERYGDSFDFIIGFGHFVKNMGPCDPKCWNSQGEAAGFEDFFEASLVCVKGLCHTFGFFGHLGYAVHYTPHQNDFYDYRHLSQWVDPLLKILIENDKSPEYNTGGFKYDLGQPNLYRRTLMHYRELGGGIITIGSDAHAPEYMGYTFDTCHELLLDCSYRYFTVYHGRKPEFIPLQSGNG